MWGESGGEQEVLMTMQQELDALRASLNYFKTVLESQQLNQAQAAIIETQRLFDFGLNVQAKAEQDLARAKALHAHWSQLQELAIFEQAQLLMNDQPGLIAEQASCTSASDNSHCRHASLGGELSYDYLANSHRCNARTNGCGRTSARENRCR